MCEAGKHRGRSAGIFGMFSFFFLNSLCSVMREKSKGHQASASHQLVFFYSPANPALFISTTLRPQFEQTKTKSPSKTTLREYRPHGPDSIDSSCYRTHRTNSHFSFLVFQVICEGFNINTLDVSGCRHETSVQKYWNGRVCVGYQTCLSTDWIRSR